MKPVDYKYAMMLSSRFEGFTVKSNNPLKINCRCTFCGDSTKSKHKKRGWLLESANGVRYHCFNCNISMWLNQVLEQLDPAMANDYLMESKLDWMKDNNIQPKEQVTKPVIDTSHFSTLKKISQLPYDHPAKLYVEKRKIPTKAHFRLYFTTKFNKFVNTFIPGKMKEGLDEPRLVIPFFDEKGKLFGFTGRSFKKDGLRYITIMLDTDKSKTFGLDKVDFTKPYMVTEGPLDSLFLDNAIASNDASLMKAVPAGYEDNAVLVFDNEKRNKEVMSQMQKAIDKGFKVCIWPSALKEKDLNDMCLSGLDVQQIINDNTYKGLHAQLAFRSWKKTTT